MNPLTVVVSIISGLCSALVTGGIVWRASLVLAKTWRDAGMEQQITDLAQAVDIKGEVIKAKDELIAQQQTWLEQRDTKIAELELKVAGQGSEIATLQQQVAELQRALGAKVLAQGRRRPPATPA